MFKNQPAGLYVLSLANTGERFGYYTMLAIFLFYLQAKFGFDSTWTGQIFSIFLALVYFMPLIGGWLADKWSFSKCVVSGIAVMFIGYALMSAPTPVRSDMSMMVLFAALLFISVGTGLFKGNLQVMVGDLYNDPRYAGKRDTAFSLFYMAINLGSMYAPGAAIALKNVALRNGGFLTSDPMAATVSNWCLDTDNFVNMPAAGSDKLTAMTDFAIEKGMAEGGDVAAFLSGYLSDFASACGQAGVSLTQFATDYITAFSTGCSYAFSLACVSLIISFLIYFFGRRTYAHIIKDKKAIPAEAKSGTPAPKQPELTPEQTKARVVALLLVFAVVIFFWMVFHQNGQTLTEFAKSCTANFSSSWTRIGFNLGALTAIWIGVYALFSMIQSATAKARAVSGVILAICVAVVAYFAIDVIPSEVTDIDPAAYQQFNPFYVVALTPFSLALFGWLAKKGKEPSAPRKIGYGMVMAGIAYCVMVMGSLSLVGTNGSMSPNWLISTYLLLTFAELLLSPMGISFVSKVAPPKLKGAMMGGWFAATAVGNYLVSIPMILWGKIPVWAIWSILIALCMLSALFIFSIMKKLEAATSDAPAKDVDALETVEEDAI
ncbi:peptide MFS transporter [uncultured Muribaculum sp.]|uniref:peptide MFS transporter n=1 Tax=uncultured Muribaculum sp. TaxID=1918613 RepID=UPI0025FD3F5D|nr:MFS transporter [uncultured Muribaculum sp.]